VLHVVYEIVFLISALSALSLAIREIVVVS
jgi:hypothetical protein